MKKIYNPEEIESIVQKYWDKKKTFHVTEDKNKKKYYCLAMLPYPSGRLHMGHVRNYTISDVIARFQRMLGKNVLHPIGWDAFGLPAEEAAIKNNIIPSEWTRKNIQYMKKQLKQLGFSYDWNREITTCHPEYYHWEQWFFNKLYDKKLVYKKQSLINWCPKDETVLANEQVIDGKCWRCQSNVILKLIPQWFIKINQYAERLLKDLNLLKKWPKKIVKMQKNWIGKSSGFEIIFNIFNTNEKITIYTDRLDLIMGITYINISPEHNLAQKASQKNKKIKHFIQEIYNTNYFYSNNNVDIIGIKIEKYALHPITNQLIPIWITNYTSLEYNTDAKISIPAHNQDDWKFAIKYNIEIKCVILLKNKTTYLQKIQQPIESQGILCNSNILNGLNSYQGSQKVFNILESKNMIQRKNNYRLQDWGISRQRYWGTPIPMTTNKDNTIIPIPDHQLPVILPEIHTMYDLKNINQIYKNWSNIILDNQNVKRETDTFDTFIESSWYYIRYTAPHFHDGMIHEKSAKYWLPIDQYVGGIEHATMHLIYFRFYHKLLYDCNLVSCKEPVKKLLCQGMVLADAFYYTNEKNQKIWISQKDIHIKKNKKGKIEEIISKNEKKIFHAGMIKMSKSKNNGIEPKLMIQKYGADTIRLFIMFAAPVETALEWNESGVTGMYRFLKKIWNLVYKYIENIKNIKIKKDEKNNTHVIQQLRSMLHSTILKVYDDIKNRQSFNTAISEIIKFTNALLPFSMQNQTDQNFMQEALNTIIKMLYPFTPHICFILWKELKNEKQIDFAEWPKYQEKFIIKSHVNIIIQINGKKKEILNIKNNTTQEQILSCIQEKTKIKNILKTHSIKRIIYIPNKLINLIILKQHADCK